MSKTDMKEKVERWRVSIVDGKAIVERRAMRQVTVGDGWSRRQVWRPYRPWSGAKDEFPVCDTRDLAIAAARGSARDSIQNTADRLRYVQGELKVIEERVATIEIACKAAKDRAAALDALT